MPFTTKDLVKQHILDHHIGSTIVAGEAIQLSASGTYQLEKRMLLQASETVKAREQNSPVQQSVLFTGDESVSLPNAKLVPESVVVASDSSLGHIYIENVDYQVDYDIGSIRRLQAGSIPADGAIIIWYLYYRVYQKGIDYDIDYQSGTIRRRTSGAIEPGQWVLVDYTAEYGSLDDGAIDNAITEANEQVASFIDEIYRDSTDRALVTAETYLAVSIICRIRAMESISPAKSRSTSGAADAQSWAAISDMYRKEAYNILSRYAGSLGSFRSPTKA
jgi:hypothetical protein